MASYGRSIKPIPNISACIVYIVIMLAECQQNSHRDRFCLICSMCSHCVDRRWATSTGRPCLTCGAGAEWWKRCWRTGARRSFTTPTATAWVTDQIHTHQDLEIFSKLIFFPIFLASTALIISYSFHKSTPSCSLGGEMLPWLLWSGEEPLVSHATAWRWRHSIAVLYDMQGTTVQKQSLIFLKIK